MSIPSELRKAIKTRYPDLVFKVRIVGFTDLAGQSQIFVESNEWGMTKGNHELYSEVKEIAAKFGAIASW